MKTIFFFIIIASLAACSSPKYAANFQRSNASYGYGELVKPTNQRAVSVAEPAELVASTSPGTGILTDAPKAEQAAAIEQVRTNYQKLNKSGKREFKKELIAQIKKLTKANTKAGVESVSGSKKTQVLDHDLKLAAVFGAVGVVALIIGTNAFNIIGGIALIIGVVFFVLWLVRQ